MIKGLIYTGLKAPDGRRLPTVVMVDMALYRKLPIYQLMAKRGIVAEIEVDPEDASKDYMTLLAMDKYKPPLDN